MNGSDSTSVSKGEHLSLSERIQQLKNRISGQTDSDVEADEDNGLNQIMEFGAKAKDLGIAYKKFKSGARMGTAGKQTMAGRVLRNRRAAILKAQRASRISGTRGALSTGLKTKMPTKVPKASIGGKSGGGYGKNIAVASLAGAGLGAFEGWNNAAAIQR